MLKSLLLSAIALLLFAAPGFSQGIGIAKSVQTTGRDQVFTLTIESFASDTLFNVQVTDDLDDVFGAGNYSISTTPTATGNLVINPSFDGSSDANLLNAAASFLKAGQTVKITFAVTIDTPTDQGTGLGNYSNQATASATDKSSTNHSDLSDSGDNPDPSGNNDPSDAGEDDPTIINLFENPIIGLAKTAAVSGSQVTLNFFLESFGNTAIINLSLTDDLDAVFGSGNYSVISGPTLISGSGIDMNTGFNGGTDKDLVLGSSVLAKGSKAQIQTVISVNNVTDQGMGLGVYQNQATASGQGSAGKTTSDLSDEGVNPDPNGNNSPGDPDENDPTNIIIGEEPAIGVSKTATVNNGKVTFTVYIENLGNTPLKSLSITEDLNSVFGAGNYNITGLTSLTVTPNTVLNTSFDGNFDTQLISGGTLNVGEVNIIQFTVENIILSDQGSGLGVYENQINAIAYSPGGAFTSDTSDDGTDPDPNGNGNPDEAGENDPTSFTISTIDKIGASLEFRLVGFSGTFPVVELFYTLENLGNRTVSDIEISQDLNALYGAGNYTHLLDPTYVTGSPTVNYNASFNGSTNTSLLNSGSYLDPGESVTFKIQHRINVITDQGFGLGIYQAQAKVDGSAPDSNPVSDLSTEGNNPDPNNDNVPDEQTPTVIDLNGNPSIGIALDASVSGNEVTLDYYLENLGNLAFSELTLLANLDEIFGNGNYTFSQPVLVDDPGTIILQVAYDGTSENSDLIDISSTLAIGETAQIRLIVSINNVSNQGFGLGYYSAQSTLRGKHPYNNYSQDLSDFGVDPDPSGNQIANEGEENDPTTFSVDAPAIGIAQTTSLSGKDVTFDIYIENLGSENLSNISIIQNLDNTFGENNYSISSAPSLITDPGTLVLDPTFNGSSKTNLLTTSSTLNAGAIAHLQMIVAVLNDTDQGNGLQVYHSQPTVSGTGSSGISSTDLSDDGTDPDPNGNNSPFDVGEDDYNVINTGKPSIGAAKLSIINGTQIHFYYVIENIGDVPLTSITATENLFSVFGFGNYTVVTQPTLAYGPNTLNIITTFDGTFAQTLISGGTLEPGEKVIISFVINVTTVSDQGDGFGVYGSQFSVSGVGPGEISVIDYSDEGIITDSNINGIANEAGENDKTFSIIGEESILGIALDASVSGNTVTFDYYFENLGNSQISDLKIINNLDDVFGAGNYSISGNLTFSANPGTITLNPSFNGSSDIDLISSGSLSFGAAGQIVLTIEVNDIRDMGNGLGFYQNQALISGNGPSGSLASDLSDHGTDPDPNGNGNALDIGENDKTMFTVNSLSIGLAHQASVDCKGEITFIYSLQNLGPTGLDSVSVEHDLDAIFGAESYYITQAPGYTSEIRSLVFNESFNGSSNKKLLLPASTIVGNGLETITVKVMPTEATNTIYSSSVITSATDANNNVVSDISDSGSNPDPDGDKIANEVGENDPTMLQTFALVSASISNQDNVSCNGLADGSATVSATGGNGSYTYSWSPSGGNNSTGVSLSAGSYTVTVTDVNNCTATASVEITQPDVLTATITSSKNLSCDEAGDGEIDLLVSGGTTEYSYSWSNSATTQDLTGLQAGTYSVTVTDANSCTATASVEITQPDTLLATITSTKDLTCFESADGEIDLTVSGGTEDYSYSWSNSATTQDLTGLAANTYSVTVTDANGCSSTASVQVYQPDLLEATISSSNNLTCYKSNDGTIELDVSGGSGHYDYSWSNSATTEDLSGLAAGTYSVTVTDDNGCTATASVEITQPDTLIATITSSKNLSCDESGDGEIDLLVSGGTTEYSYNWSNSATTQDLTGLQAGTYSVTVTDANSCTATASVEITQPDTLLATITSTKDLTCFESADGEIDLTVSGGTEDYSYSWSNAATTQDLTNLTAGTYTVTVTDANSCSATASVELTQPDLLKATIISSNNLSCYQTDDGDINISVSGGTTNYTYSWSNSETTQDLRNLSAGTYSVTVTDANSCTATASVEITQPDILTATITSSTNLSCDESGDGTVDLSVAGGTVNYSYSWSNSETTQDLSGLQAGTYSVTVTDANSCTATTSVEITQPDTLLATVTSSTDLTCFESADGAIDLSVSGGTADFTYSWSNEATTQDLTNLAAGTYTVTVTDANSCSATASVVLTQPLEPTLSEISHTDPTTCGGSEGEISFTTENVTDGTYKLTYTWNSFSRSINVTLSGGSFTIQNLPSGVYANFSLTYGKCIVSMPGQIDLLGPVFETSASNTGPYNVGDKIQLMVASGVEFSWKGPNNFYSFAQAPVINSAQEASAGIYEVIVKGANNCVDTVSTTVVVNCLPSQFKYYLVYGGQNPEVVTELTDGLSFQPEPGRLLNVFAIPNCTDNPIESMKLQLSGTTELQYREDNAPIYALYEAETHFGGDFWSPNLFTFIATAYDQDNAQGNDLYGQEVIQFYIVDSKNKVTAPAPGKAFYCNGEEFVVNVSSTGSFVAGNLFQVYLSDKNGSFMTSQLIGFSSDPSNIPCKLPTDAASGSNYKIKVVSTAPVVNSAISASSFAIVGANLSLNSTQDDINGQTQEKRAVISIEAVNDIGGNGRVDFKAGKNIQLKPGFSVESGSVFSSQIENQCPE